ncbi:MAG: 50S ribosomal protein L30 [Promethearchaeota archaeon]
MLLVIRIRGPVKVNYKIEDTLKMLRLHKVNHAVILFADKTVQGMIKKVNNYVCYGELDKKVLLSLLKKRAFLIGNKRLTDEHLKYKTEYPNINKLADALIKGKVSLKDIDRLKPLFRLHPPRGGFRGSIKKSYNSGGTLGNVGDYINILIKKMIA